MSNFKLILFQVNSFFFSLRAKENRKTIELKKTGAAASNKKWRGQLNRSFTSIVVSKEAPPWLGRRAKKIFEIGTPRLAKSFSNFTTLYLIFYFFLLLA